jgi:DNA recombination protein RmuC
VTQREAELATERDKCTALETARTAAEERAIAAQQAKEDALEIERRNFEEQKSLLTEAERILGEKFSDISFKSLQRAQEVFLETANQKFEGTTQAAAVEMDKRQQAFEHLVKPIAESLEKLDKQSAVMDEGIKTLSRETDQLANALRKPVARGDWGEMLLVKTLQNAGLVEGQHFTVEHSTELADEGRRRADVVIHLPHGRDIIIDAKTPLEAYTEGVNAIDEDTRRERFAHHSRLVRDHVRTLSSKKYWERYKDSADFVILFLPTEGSYQAAIEADPSLLEEGDRARVFLANPVSVMCLVQLANHTWSQHAMAENAQKVREHAAELYKRIQTFLNHFTKIGDSLHRSMLSYNAAAGSLEGSVLPQARRIPELKATNADMIEPLAPITNEIRQLSSAEARLAAAEEPQEELL